MGPNSRRQATESQDGIHNQPTVYDSDFNIIGVTDRSLARNGKT